MLIAKDLCLTFGTQTIFDHVSFTMEQRQKIGLIGRNGAGKSTLLKIIAGQQGVDDGTISVERDKKIAYLPQEVVLLSDKTILEEALASFAEVFSLKKELEAVEAQLAADGAAEKDPALVERYAHLLHDFAQYNVGELESETKIVLQGLGIGSELWDKPVSQLSVGWKMRLVLGKLLLQKADLYLFDEPTNHLDIVAKDWFLEFLKTSKAGFMLVTHDRYFLDHACEYIFELDRGKGTMYHGNYTTYMQLKEQAEALKEKAYLAQQREIKKKMETINRFRAKASKASMAQSMLKSLEKIERIELDTKPGAVHFSFAPVVRTGNVVLHVENLAKNFGEKHVFDHVTFDVFRGEKVALIAANGVGKTTLLSIIMGPPSPFDKAQGYGEASKLAADNGTVEFGHNVSAALFEQDQERSLNRNNTILDEVESVCRTSETRSMVRGLLGSFLFPGDDVLKRIAVLSGGEKNRVAMVKVLLAQANFLILDEPTNHLDLVSKDVLLQAMEQFKGTILFVSHDRTFLDAVATRIIELTPHGIYSYTGNYESYLYHKHVAQEKQQAAKELAEKKVAGQSNKLQPQVQVQPKPQGKEAYEARKKRTNLENKIDKLEKEHAWLHKKFEALEWGTDEYDQAAARLKEIDALLAAAYEEWENLAGG